MSTKLCDMPLYELVESLRANEEVVGWDAASTQALRRELDRRIRARRRHALDGGSKAQSDGAAQS